MSEQEYLFYLKAVRSYKIGRNFPVLFFAFTIGSFITSFFGAPCILNIFSCALFLIYGQNLKSLLISEGNTQLVANSGLALCIIIAVIIFAIFITFYALSKRKRWAYFLQMILFFIDTVIVFIFELGYTTFFFDFILHLIALFLTVKGYIHSKQVNDDFDDGVATTEADVTEIYNMINKLNKLNS